MTWKSWLVYRFYFTFALQFEQADLVVLNLNDVVVDGRINEGNWTFVSAWWSPES